MNPEQTAPAASAPEHQAALDAAATNATTAERTRIAALTEIAGGNHQVELNAAIAEGKSAGDFAIALNAAQREQAKAALEGAKADAVSPTLLPTKSNASAEAGGVVNRGTAIVAKLQGKHPGLPARG